MENKSNEIGKLIRRKRQELEMTQTDLANRLNVATATISKYEQGIVSDIPRSRILAISNILNIEPAEFFKYNSQDGYKPDTEKPASKLEEHQNAINRPQVNIKPADLFSKQFQGFSLTETDIKALLKELIEETAAKDIKTSFVPKMTISKEEEELLEIYRSLDMRGRLQVTQAMLNAEEESNKRKRGK
ncbi:MAG: helix-turn-helix domain-containing protein [Eubacterium sp.]|nr:helix-turn-helix domain-containing protein [Candidatus Colimonas fimequi]